MLCNLSFIFDNLITCKTVKYIGWYTLAIGVYSVLVTKNLVGLSTYSGAAEVYCYWWMACWLLEKWIYHYEKKLLNSYGKKKLLNSYGQKNFQYQQNEKPLVNSNY